MSRLPLSSAIAALLVLGACATATPYQAAIGTQKGYVDQQIENNRWQISFAGNSLTDRQTVETYLLYRAAELTDMEGFDHFKVIRRDTDEDRRVYASGYGSSPYFSSFYCDYRFYGRRGRLHGFPRSWGAHYYDPFWGPAWDYREVVRYEATTEIVMGKGDKPEDPSYFNADEVLMNLVGQIQRPEV